VGLRYQDGAGADEAIRALIAAYATLKAAADGHVRLTT
jgi:hypothetical protein